MTQNGNGSGDAGGMGTDPHGPGWWVSSDGRWHSPDEEFDADVPARDHPIRKVAIVLLAVIVVGATTVGAWLGGSSQTAGSPGGPSPGALTSQVKEAVTGTGIDDFGVADVTSVVCGRPDSWSPGKMFHCEVYGSSHQELGMYDGTVEPTTASGYWQWTGTWHPSHHSPSTDE